MNGIRQRLNVLWEKVSQAHERNIFFCSYLRVYFELLSIDYVSHQRAAKIQNCRQSAEVEASGIFSTSDLDIYASLTFVFIGILLGFLCHSFTGIICVVSSPIAPFLYPHYQRLRPTVKRQNQPMPMQPLFNASVMNLLASEANDLCNAAKTP